jgi:acyl transferase domain-containing protein
MPIADSIVNARQDGERKALLLKALQAIDSLQSRLDAAERDRNEPIAIVGLSCRFPDSKDPEAFWRLLSDGVDAIKEVPSDRWDKIACHPDLSISGKLHAPFGGFLDQVDLFDAAFFGISGREAESMDPQQRLLLEVTWETLENAGIATTPLRGSSTGVFVGISSSDYASLAIATASTKLDVYAATGGALNVAAGRLSYVLGLNGPAMAVDTACSSSLVAVHLACQSLHARECDLALAGGVNLLLAPEPFICLSKMGVMAPDGRCKTFDGKADGFVRGEGCGMIALKRLSDALAAGDQVLALIRGTAVNQDGASSGLTVPNGSAQQAVVRAALKAGRLHPHDVDYIEAHGTGTALGDPIELEALAAVLGKNRAADRPLRVGSVKTNFGHLESAAGIAGLIKVVLSMGHEEIPGQLHFHNLNPRISLDGAPIEVPTKAIAWPRSERPRIAGVSSFGFSGTNAHVILQEPPAAKDPATSPQSPDRTAHLMVLSASSEMALRKLSAAYAERLAKERESALPDICYTAAIGRSTLSHRLAFPTPNIAVARDLLSTFAQGKSHSDIVSGRVRSDTRVAFLFTGQGAQHSGMGRDLYKTEPVFRDAFEQCALLLGEHLDRPLQEIVGYDTDSATPAGILDETRHTQPALFAVEYALASLWRSWGIEPAAIVGHSVGEYVGACVAGALSLEDALRLVALRSRLMQSLPRNGAMAAVLAGEDRVRVTIAPYAESVSIAATNSPLNTVISGKADDVHSVLERLRKEGVESKPLNVSHAFHSPLIEPILDEFERCAGSVAHQAPVVDLVSNLTGCPLEETLPMDAFYWRRHARETVRFAESIRELHARGIEAFLEIGPAPVLIGLARQCVGDSETTWLASLRKDRDDCPQMLSSLGVLFVLGAKPDWAAYDQPYGRRRVALPTYPFQRERHWLPAASADSGGKRTQTSGHPLLGIHVPLAGRPGEHVWFGEISLEICPWIGDHRVEGAAVMPPTAYVEMAVAAAVEAVSELPVVLTRIEMEQMLLLQPATEFEIQTRLEQQVAGNMAFQVHSRRKNLKENWTLHASGTLRVGGMAVPATTLDVSELDAFKKRSSRKLEGAEFYRLHEERGNQWGPCFRGISRVWQGQGEALSEVTVPLCIHNELSRYVSHPAFSDSLGQILTATIPLEKKDGNLGGIFVSAGFEEVRVYRRPEGRHFYSFAQLRSDQAAPDNTLVGDIRAFDVSGNLIVEILGARLSYLDSAQKHLVPESVEHWFYEPQWLVKETVGELSPEISMTGTWIIFRDRQGIGDAVCAQLRKRGATCLCVDYGQRRSQTNETLMTIRPENADDYDWLLRAAARKDSVPHRIVHLWSLDAADPEKADLNAVREAQTLGPISALQIVQSLERARLTAHPKLWLISRGAQPAGEKPTPLSMLQSPLWGLGRTIAMENGDFWGGMVDLDPADTPATAGAMLIRQLFGNRDEDQTAFRHGRRHVLRLARRTKTASKPELVTVRPNATYLITGGLGGVGLVIARWLVGRGARHLILAGRSLLPNRQEWDGVAKGTIEGTRITAIRELESLGTNVQTVAVDMGNETSVNGMINQCLRADQPPLRGVFHAAGEMQYQSLDNQTVEQMRNILSAKMVGGWFLHRLLADVPLELFVLFSSSSSLLSSPMMGSYSAGNVFLDALAHHRRATGKVALSVNWGTWAETGMATRFWARKESGLHTRMGATKGGGLLSNQRALEALERLLEQDAVQAGVMPMDWASWKQYYGSLAGTPYFSLLISENDFGTPFKSAHRESREHILAAQPETRMEMLESYLAKQMARILKVPLASVESETPIVNMGIDSLMAIELKNQIETDLSVSVAMGRLIQGPTLLELTDWVMQLLVAEEPVDATEPVDSLLSEYEEGVL